MSDFIEKAEELALSGKFEEALGKYDEAIGEDPSDPLTYVGKASVLKALGRYDECIECMDTAVRIIPEWKGTDPERIPAFTSMLLVLKAEAQLYAEKPNEALVTVDEADEIRTADAASLVVRAQAYAQLQNYEAAGNCLYRAEEWCFLHDDAMLTQIWLSKVHLAKEAGKPFVPPYASEVYKSGNWRTPVGTAEELFERGNNLRSEGLLYDALRYYDACLAAEPKNKALVLFFRGIIFEQLKNFGEAYSMYSDALAAGPAPEDEMKIRVRWANAKSRRI
ncbi:Tetratricopeptide TPR_2 repeat protein [Methanocorpusculum labreanum Z]|uniref:Tetratricopeptide TPR_2 repeat protein n=1 Tax=Methanocorpusculum labreanum (strain ATCC 43576 / DSM 4855 / Z) TaxID=410358 RepID=A2ST70_METLZ|nr:tetratricopeptide repeat protein [Methanocorpusculum labreanum]ABN07526.1 Tetratricopeptide TPR_2 repeat protein [Methanocorpusculum labreanum Z]